MNKDFYLGIYRLVDGKPVKVGDAIEWASFYREDRNVKKSTFFKKGKRYWVSTVFLGIDHNFGFGPPLLYETMVFKYKTFRDIYMERYTTAEEALEGHKKIVEIIKKEGIEGLDFFEGNE